MYEDPTPEVLAHIRAACDHIERAAIAVPEDLLGPLLGALDEMLSFVVDCDDELPVARLPLPDVQGVLDALLDARAYERPVSATDVARILWHGEHQHGDLCRVGQRLRLMAGFGLIVRYAGSRANRWGLAAAPECV